jgi:hypothetical protein
LRMKLAWGRPSESAWTRASEPATRESRRSMFSLRGFAVHSPRSYTLESFNGSGTVRRRRRCLRHGLQPRYARASGPEASWMCKIIKSRKSRKSESKKPFVIGQRGSHKHRKGEEISRVQENFIGPRCPKASTLHMGRRRRRSRIISGGRVAYRGR